MDTESYNIRVPKRWTRIAMIVGVTALIVAPLTAVATHSFNDVPNTNTFHDDIAWLKDAAVTLGCNPPDNNEFCPDDNVTREQMAAFMKRLAENQVVDAAKLEGDSASDLQSHALLAHQPGVVDLPGGATTEVIALQLPPGTYLITGSAILNNDAGTTERAGCILAAGPATAATSLFPLAANSAGGERAAWTLHLVTEFNATTEATISCDTSAGWFGSVIESQIAAVSVQTATASVLGQQNNGNEDG